MIAKRVHRVRGGSFKRLGRYIVKLEVAKWQRTANYILDTLGAGKRAANIRISNCQAEELEEALAEITATQTRNRRAKGERTYHLVVSFPEGERPRLDQLRDIEDELCAAIGLGAHQRLSAIHTDTAHLHIHVAINQIHPQTFACIEPWYDKAKLMASCERLEIKHGLQRTSHGASQRRVAGRAGDMEAHSGEASFAGWIKREVLPSLTGLLDDGGDWPALHQALAAHGLLIRERGAGLIIAEAKSRWRVKASSIDRRLSCQSLAKRWGPFLPAAPLSVTPQQSAYRKAPLKRSAGIDALYIAYQRQRPEALARRTAVFRKFYQEEARRREELQRWSREAIARIRRQDRLTRGMRKTALARHRAEKAALQNQLQEQSRRDWRALRGLYPTFNWQGFLQAAADAGHAEAALALRGREGRFVRAIAVIHPGNADWQASPITRRQFRPQNQNRHVTYRTGDGGRIIDHGEVIDLPSDTREAVLLAFSILAARFPGQAIALKGDDAFTAKAIEIAALEKPEVRFADPAHEAQRQSLAAAKPEREGETLGRRGAQ